MSVTFGVNPKLRLVLFFNLLLLVSVLGFSQGKTNLELTDIFSLEYVSDPQVSPDGTRVIYVRNFKDIMTDRNLSKPLDCQFRRKRQSTTDHG